MDIVSSRAQKNKLELTVIVEPFLCNHLIGDSFKIRQILINLIDNALKFTPQGGEVVLHVTREKLNHKKINLKFQVRDTGIGIPKDKLHLLFKPFAQLGCSPELQGTGLGLVISRKILETMGGSVTVESAGVPGKGTTFHLSIPLEICLDVPKEPKKRPPYSTVFIYVKRQSTERAIQNQFSQWESSLRIVHNASDLTRVRKTDLIIADYCLLKSLNKRIHDSAKVIVLVDYEDQSHVTNFPKNFSALLKPYKRSLLHRYVSTEIALVSPPSLTESVLQPIKVLVVEDNEVNQRVLAAILKRNNIEFKAAFNGKEAVEITEQEDFDMILMDVQMPVMNGLESTTLIRERERRRKSKRSLIIAVTAAASEEDKQTCLSAGMDGYVSKPLYPAQIRDLLDTHFSSSSK